MYINLGRATVSNKRTVEAKKGFAFLQGKYFKCGRYTEEGKKDALMDDLALPSPNYIHIKEGRKIKYINFFSRFGLSLWSRCKTALSCGDRISKQNQGESCCCWTKGSFSPPKVSIPHEIPCHTHTSMHMWRGACLVVGVSWWWHPHCRKKLRCIQYYQRWCWS